MRKTLRNMALAALVLSSFTSANAAITGSGTAADPYLIATAEDLCNGWSKMVDGQITYFKQTADIDMKGITDYVTFCGHSGSYSSCIYYDGDNHLISNFAPTDRIAGTGDKAYYCTSVFGVMSGTIKNLGIVDADINVDWFEAGIIGGFAGVGDNAAVTPEAKVENVFVTGKIKSTKSGAVAGGFFGTSGLPVNISNSYAQVEIENDGYAAGIIANAGTETKISYSYASATVTGKPAALIAAAVPDKSIKITFDNVVAFGTGDACNIATTGNADVYPAGSSAGIDKVQSWPAFDEGDYFNELPALNWQFAETGGIEEITVDNNAKAEYFNLQGVKVDNPAAGIYLVRQGSRVSKVLMK